jgi:hypothetical protein
VCGTRVGRRGVGGEDRWWGASAQMTVHTLGVDQFDVIRLVFIHSDGVWTVATVAGIKGHSSIDAQCLTILPDHTALILPAPS